MDFKPVFCVNLVMNNSVIVVCVRCSITACCVCFYEVLFFFFVFVVFDYFKYSVFLKTHSKGILLGFIIFARTKRNQFLNGKGYFYL